MAHRHGSLGPLVAGSAWIAPISSMRLPSNRPRQSPVLSGHPNLFRTRGKSPFAQDFRSIRSMLRSTGSCATARFA